MTQTIEVYIEFDNATSRVGRCHCIEKSRSQSSVFEYAANWLETPQAFAIDPENLPLQRTSFHRTSNKSALPGALRDTAPDRWGQQLIRRAFRKAGERRTLTEVDYLLGINDGTRIGALRYKRVGEETFDHDIGRYRVPPLVSLPALLNAADAVREETESAEDLRLLLNEGSPIGGARPKSVVQEVDGTLAVAKFSKNDDHRSIPHGEVLAMTLARKAGVHTANARLLDVAGRPVALIERFDRDGERRIPFLSAMTLLDLDDGNEAAYTDIAEVIRMHSSAPTRDLHELWRRIVFNVLASNLDDHLRNHGFLYDGDGKWRLSPAYDLNPVPIEEKAKELSTWISEEGPDANIDLAFRAAKYFALRHAEAKTIVDEVSGAFVGWRNLARQLGMSRRDIDAYASALPQT